MIPNPYWILFKKFWWAIPIVALALSCAYYKTRFDLEHSGKIKVEAAFDKFKTDVATLGEQAEKDAKQKDAENEKRIKDASTDRDTALKCLRDDACAGRRHLPLLPPPTRAGDEICFDQTTLAAAVERYRGRVQAVVTSGDEAQIDAVTLLRAWPSALRADSGTPR